MAASLSTTVPEFLRTKKDENKPPLSSWSRRTSFYDGNVLIEERFDWDDEVPVIFGEIDGFETSQICHLKDTFVELHTGEIEDVHDFYFAGGEALEKIRMDFKTKVMPLWQMARRIDCHFPHHTTSDLANILDPLTDNQPVHFNSSSYATIKRSRLSGCPAMVEVEGGTDKGTSWTKAEIFYGYSGNIEGLDCEVRRKSKYHRLRLRNSSNGLYIKKIETDAKLGEKPAPTFEVKGSRQYKKALISRGLIKSDGPKKPRLDSSGKKCRANKPAKKFHAWTNDEEDFLLGHPGLTARELAAKFSVSMKAIERKRAALRAKQLQDYL